MEPAGSLAGLQREQECFLRKRSQQATRVLQDVSCPYPGRILHLAILGKVLQPQPRRDASTAGARAVSQS